MTGRRTGLARMMILLLALLLAAQACVTAACADDAELEKLIPGEWTCPYEADDEGKTKEGNQVVTTFGKDGKVTLYCSGVNGGKAYTCEGTWAFELVTGDMDRLTLLFTSTDNPLHAGNEYRVECKYYVNMESWEENDGLHTAFSLVELSHSGTTPFEEIYGYAGPALYKVEGPNMKVVNCTSYVSLRAKRSKSAKRLAKVPLGAAVLAFPEAGEEKGFLWCLYQGTYGFILKEYLQPIE